MKTHKIIIKLTNKTNKYYNKWSKLVRNKNRTSVNVLRFAKSVYDSTKLSYIRENHAARWPTHTAATHNALVSARRLSVCLCVMLHAVIITGVSRKGAKSLWNNISK